MFLFPWFYWDDDISNLKKRVPKGQGTGGGSLVWQLKTVYAMNMLHIWYLRVPLRMENMLNTYFDVIQAIENFLELHEVQKVIKNQLFSCFWASKSPFSLASNQKKVACVHVFMHKNCLKHRMTTPFTSACTYEPKHVLNIIFECYQLTKKFWGEPKGTSSDLQNYNFFGYFKLILALEMILNTLSPKIIACWRFCN